MQLILYSTSFTKDLKIKVANIILELFILEVVNGSNVKFMYPNSLFINILKCQ